LPDHDHGNLRRDAAARGKTDEGIHAKPGLLRDHQGNRGDGLLKSQYSKRGKSISFQDASIAAVCIAYGCTLVTENTKDFPMPELQLYPLSRKTT